MYTPSADDRAQAALLRRLWLGFARGEAAPAELPPFSAGGGYTAGLVGKRKVVPAPGWRAELCGALEAAGVWRTEWWAN